MSLPRSTNYAVVPADMEAVRKQLSENSNLVFLGGSYELKRTSEPADEEDEMALLSERVDLTNAAKAQGFQLVGFNVWD